MPSSVNQRNSRHESPFVLFLAPSRKAHLSFSEAGSRILSSQMGRNSQYIFLKSILTPLGMSKSVIEQFLDDKTAFTYSVIKLVGQQNDKIMPQ